VVAGRVSADRALTLFVDHVTHVDCGVLDARLGLVGRTWLVDAELTGRRDASGMLFDFGPAKKQLKAQIDALIDHRLLVATQMPGLSLDGARLHFQPETGQPLDYSGPPAGVALIDSTAIDIATLEAWLTPRTAHVLPANVDALKLTLREEVIDGAHYHYCHGLKSHDGNCQRMGHGHRCRLAIAIDGENRPDIAAAWAARWQGIFIGQREDQRAVEDGGRLRFAYAAEQGHFEMIVDAARCVVLDGPPTVENIADYLAGEVAREHVDHTVRVRAYEGVGKGAIATRG